jgi:hypothetical protein
VIYEKKETFKRILEIIKIDKPHDVRFENIMRFVYFIIGK